jgi:CelD/BcsL family acetyltransferase involved in cellulose biosynthesis
MSALTARVITDRGALDALVPAWNALLADGARAAPFSTPEWQLGWLDTISGSTPRYVVVSDESGAVRGILPLALRPRRRGPLMLRALELGGEAVACGDHLGFVTRDADFAAAWAAAAPLIQASAADTDLVRLASVDQDEAAAAAAALSGSPGWRPRAQGEDVAPRMPLPQDGRDVLEGFRANRRAKLRYYERHFATSHPSGAFVVNDARVPVDQAFDALVELHGSRWQVRGEAGVMADGEFTAFARRFSTTAHERGWLRLHQLFVNDRIAAVLLALHWRDTASAWLLGWNPAFGKWNVSELLFVHSMREAAREGLHTYDFLRGREPYKFRFPVEAPALVRHEWTMTSRGHVAAEVGEMTESVLASGRRWRTRAERVVTRLRGSRD